MAIRVLVCDDSALMRAMLSELIARQPGMEVVGVAADALVAREMIRSHKPDVLTLDVEMPRMDGLDFLARLMKLNPMPVVMISSFTDKGSEASVRALELGAVEVLGKPRARTPEALEEYAQELGERIRAAYQARLRRLPQGRPAEHAPPSPAARPALPAGGVLAAARPVFIGASTGGTEAIKTVLLGLPATMPPVFIVQHMPEMFTGSFAKRLDGLCALRVKEAEDGERALAGVAYLAPGHSHLTVQRVPGGGFQCRLARSAPVNRHRPSVDVLFDSAAAQVGAAALGVLLTGMGKDGARGLLAMRQAGAWTIAQDESSCVVYGMPREAVNLGGASEVVALDEIAARMQQRLAGMRAPAAP
ncbi:protein-glutamate methylesterase/protein-glutamine glutaminase [Pseudothauera lacus]|uniref:Protein-glutamate methylesterase/protein-glutamine glutaminase n=1 Tax=Pseudothauera lacus TaxID=2136175 RepID=A0A2T4IBY6_9RHOO|nr:chemotaxis response regulator protein-glutamate methylesterase [Pseudothauera lacus]PTD95289.1 chemotaxis response regulator protein-glutamate methylesterase [Pseudothauera lacus]